MNHFKTVFRPLFALLLAVIFQTALSAQDSGKKVAPTTFFVDRQYAKSFPFTLKPEAEVVQDPGYQAYDEAFSPEYVRALTPERI